MRYFYHKLGKGNSLVEKYLSNARAGQMGQIAIFFGESTIEDCLDGEEGPDAREFCLAGDPKNRSNTRVVVVANREFWVLQPEGSVKQGEEVEGEDGKPDREKLLPVKVLVRKSVAEIPHLLASMGSNAYWSQGTFRKIGDESPELDGGAPWDRWPHQYAIEQQLPRSLRRPKLPRATQESQLLFLSSVELETLVAKAFEEAGCFVPAYRGGTMADVDIFACNDTPCPVSIGSVTIKPGEKLAIQVKSWMNDPPRCVDGVLSVSLNLHPKDRGIGWNAEALWRVVQSSPQTLLWFKRSISWLPKGLIG